MKEHISNLLTVTLITILFLFLAFLAYVFLLSDLHVNTDDYLTDLADVHEVYNLDESDIAFEKDLQNIGFVKTGENRYERAYNNVMCEVVFFDDTGVTFSVGDTCVSALELIIVEDFDNDSLNTLYFVTSDSNTAYLRKYGEDYMGIMSYNFESGEYELHGDISNYNQLLRYNNAYYAFLTQLNARVF